MELICCFHIFLTLVLLKDVIHCVVQDWDAKIKYVFLKDAIHRVVQDWDAMLTEYVFLFPAHWMNNAGEEKYAIMEYVNL